MRFLKRIYEIWKNNAKFPLRFFPAWEKSIMEHYKDKYFFVSLTALAEARNEASLKTTGWKLWSTNKSAISDHVSWTAYWIPWHEGESLNYFPFFFFIWRPSSITDCRPISFLLSSHRTWIQYLLVFKTAMKGGYRTLSWPGAKFIQLDLLASKKWCQPSLFFQCLPVLHSCVQIH